MNYIKAFLIALPIIVALDLTWIAGLMSKFYQTRLHDLLRFGVEGGVAPRLLPTVLTYVFMILLVVLFAVPKGVSGGPLQGFIWGAVLGILTYGLYNYTNLALFDKYNSVLAVVDTLWGGVIFGLTTLIVTLFI